MCACACFDHRLPHFLLGVLLQSCLWCHRSPVPSSCQGSIVEPAVFQLLADLGSANAINRGSGTPACNHAFTVCKQQAFEVPVSVISSTCRVIATDSFLLDGLLLRCQHLHNCS
jgi:hypothetical protein